MVRRTALAIGLTRESTLLWLALALAVLTYLKQHGNPVEWTFDQWVSAGVAGVIWLIGKLQHSPLPGHTTRPETPGSN